MKFRATIITVKEFETTLEDYPEGTEDEALRMEQQQAEDDPELYFEDGKTSVVVERID